MKSPTAPAPRHGLWSAGGFVLPAPRSWLLAPALLSLLVLAGGLAARTAGPTGAELAVDQEVSRDHVGFLNAAAMVLNVLFAPKAGIVVVLAICVVLLLARRQLLQVIAFGAVSSLGWVASAVFKLLVARQRPDPGLLADPLAPETGSNSFPSGHVCFAVALAFALYFLARNTSWARPVAVLGAAAALTVAASRVYIGVHYPSDVAASFAGTTAAVLFFAGCWNRWLGPRLARLPLLAPSPGPSGGPGHPDGS